MRRSPIVLTALALAFASLPGLTQSDRSLNTLTGPVTAISPNGGFDVAGRHILSSTAHLCTHVKKDVGDATEKCNEDSFDPKDLFIGEQVKLSGSHQSNHSFAAAKVFILSPDGDVGGTAVIDLVPTQQPANSAERLIRADGYLLNITPDSKLTLATSLNSIADISAGQWIQYSGTQQADGIVHINTAVIFPNTVSDQEAKIRKDSDYDPLQVPYEEAQDQLSLEFLASYYKHIGPWPDAAMQARVQRIGNSLVPAYQRALPDSDPAKINFRFSVVNQKSLLAGLPLPSGVILLPRQIVERLQNDDQLAAVLAADMAQVLEKDDLRLTTVNRASLASELAGDAAGIFVPGLDLATGIVGAAARAHVRGHQLTQNARVSLCLLHDAGYDIQQAPLALWHLAGKKNEPLEKVDLPGLAEILYNSLGTAWRNPIMNAAQPPFAPGASTSTAQR